MFEGVSKAFTKEDGETETGVLRRRAPLPEGTPNYVTNRGMQSLREELARLVAAPSPGESVDRPLHAARRAELEQRIASAVLVSPPADRGEVRFGALVEIADGDGRRREVRIVGVDEANPTLDAIAFIAPLARALLGRRVGDTITVRTPGGEEELEVLAIAYD